MTLETLKQGLAHLDEVLPKMSFDLVGQELSANLPRVPIPIVDFDNKPFFFGQREYGGPNMVCRARVNGTKGVWAEDNFQTVKSLSYVPAEDLHKIAYPGRVNKAHESIFYGAFNGSTAAIEALHANKAFIESHSAFITIARWRITQPMKLADIPLSQTQHDSMYKYLSGMGDAKSKFSEEFFQKQADHMDRSGYSEIDKFVLGYFADKFCESKADNEHYKISNYYVDRVFNRYPNHPMTESGVEGILYSSIAGSYQDKNIALLPSVVDAKLEFVDAQLVWARFSDNIFNINTVDRASADAEGNLHWQEGR